MSYNNFHIIQLFVFIVLYPLIISEFSILMNPKCKSSINYNPDTTNFLLETLHGKIPIKLYLNDLSNYDINIIEKLNLNIKCPYIVYDNYSKINKTIGIFLGVGINLTLNNFTEYINYINAQNFDDKNYYINLLNDIHKSDLNSINESFLNKYNDHFNDIDIINNLTINYEVEKLVKKYNINQNIKNPLFISLLALYLQNLITDDEFYNYLSNNQNYNLLEFSYNIEHLIEFFPYTRYIQSKLINLCDANFRYNYNHIFIVIEKNIFSQNEIDVIKVFITRLYEKIINNNNYNKNRISILIKNKNNYNYIIDYQEDTDKNQLDNLLQSDNKSEIIINLSEIYSNINQKYEENKKNYYENKIAVLLLNYDSIFSEKQNPDILIENFKKEYQIQTIPVININNEENYFEKDIFKYNIFNNFSEVINYQYILLAISNMHIPIILNNNNKISLSNIKNNDIDTPLFFEILIPETTGDKNENQNITEYYEISLDIISSYGYNIFISNINPFPNIRNNLNNFLKYKDETNPKIRIKANDIKNNTFYICIEGNLNFNLNIEKKIFEGNADDLILSEGEYYYETYNIKLHKGDINEKFTTFGENFTLESESFFKDISMENVIKYFTRGIDIYNTEDGSYLNYDLFLYLYGDTILNRIYKDNNDVYYFGRMLKLKDYSPNRLKKEGFNKFFINKLYLFLNMSSSFNDTAPGVYFESDEIKKIYKIAFTSSMKALSSRLKTYPNCVPLENQKPTIKFILFCLFFVHQRSNIAFKAIVNLSLKEPDYTNVLNLLDSNEFKKHDSDYFLLYLIKREEQEDNSEKIMTNILMGKSLFLSNVGKNFIYAYSNIMTKTMTKIAISVYDTYNNKIEKIIPFYSTNNYQKIEEIINKYESENNRYLYNSKQKMDFKLINEFTLNQFNHYDKGIKKKLLLLCDENLEEDGYIINNELIINKNYQEIKDTYLLTQKQINLILLTSKNYEKGYTPDLFKLYSENNDNNYNIYENYFHVNNLNKTDEYISDLSCLIKSSPIKVKLGQRLINDFYFSKNSYYEIDCSSYPNDVIVIKTNMTNFNIYASLSNPYPYYSDNGLIEKKNEESIVISKCKQGVAYFSLEPKFDVKKEIIEIFSCVSYQPDSDCKFINSNKTLWIIFASITFCFVLFLIIYKCRYNTFSRLDKKNKKRLNFYDKVK